MSAGRWHTSRPNRGPTPGGPPVDGTDLDRPVNVHTYDVDLASLAILRAAVTRHGRQYGLPDGPLTDLVLIANELATNVVRHGGGTGRLSLWRRHGCVFCEVSDHGPGIRDPSRVGDRPTEANAVTGRGLWLIHQMTDTVHIDTGPDGTTVTVAVPITR